MNTCDVVIHNARLVAPSDPCGASALAVAHGVIVGLGTDATVLGRYRPERSIDAARAVVHPGFIDAHTHIGQYSSRSAGATLARHGLTMGHWKGELIGADEVASARLAMHDLLLSGYTAFVEPGTVVDTDALAAAVTETGMRAWITDPYVADRPEALGRWSPELLGGRFAHRWPRSFEEAASRVGGQLFRNDDGTTLHGYVGLYGEGTDSPDLYAYAADVAHTNGVVVQKHLGYRPESTVDAERELGATPVRWAADRGLLTGASFVHLNRLEPADADLLADAGASCVWCPYGQLQVLSHPQVSVRQVDLHRAGAAVGLGSDIARATDVDGVASLAMAAAAAGGTDVRADELLWMRTRGAAATMGRADVGDLTVGARADIVVRTAGDTAHLGPDPVWETAVFGARGSVRTVLVDGRVVVDDGVPQTFDPRDVADRARSSVGGILRRLGIS